MKIYMGGKQRKRGVKTEPCKCVWRKKKVARIKVQPKRATLRSDSTQAVRYTAENGGGMGFVKYFV